MPLYTGFIQLGAGLSVGLAGLAAGFAIGIVGDAGVRGTAQQPRLFVGMVSFGPSVFFFLFVGVRSEEIINHGLTTSFYNTDPYPHFRRSSWSLRAHCRAHLEHQLCR